VKRAAAGLFGIVVLGAAGLVGCSSSGGPGGSAASFPGQLCHTVQAWSDQSVDAVNDFSLHSSDAAVAQRRVLYAAAFDRLEGLLTQLADRVDQLPAAPQDPDAIRDQLHTALTLMHATTADGKAGAAALPDASYEYASVSNGRLFTGMEKNQAILFAALQAMSDRYDDNVVPPGCGRRSTGDLSPSLSF
jgi:hypothetical protein